MKLNLAEVVKESDEDQGEVFDRVDQIFNELADTFGASNTKSKKIKWKIEAEKKRATKELSK